MPELRGVQSRMLGWQLLRVGVHRGHCWRWLLPLLLLPCLRRGLVRLGTVLHVAPGRLLVSHPRGHGPDHHEGLLRGPDTILLLGAEGEEYHEDDKRRPKVENNIKYGKVRSRSPLADNISAEGNVVGVVPDVVACLHEQENGAHD